MRLILYIFIIVAFVLFGGRSRYRRWGRMYGPGYYSDRSRSFTLSSYEREYDYPPLRENIDYGGPVRSFMRRRNALKDSAQFLTKQDNVLNLKNKQVVLAFDTKKEVMTLIDLKNLSRSTTVYWNEQTESILRATDNKFSRTFDEICFSFDERANYQGILNVLKERFAVIHVVDSEADKLLYKQQNEMIESSEEIEKQKQETESIKKININTATEEEITALPGINVVTAKKIINYRKENDGFKTLEEFFSEMKIKKHFQEQLAMCIYVVPIEKKEKPQNTDRIIDF